MKKIHLPIKAIVVSIVLAAMAVPRVSQANNDEWNDSSGKWIKGEFVGADNDRMIFRKNGKEFSIPIGNISPDTLTNISSVIEVRNKARIAAEDIHKPIDEIPGWQNKPSVTWTNYLENTFVRGRLVGYGRGDGLIWIQGEDQKYYGVKTSDLSTEARDRLKVPKKITDSSLDTSAFAANDASDTVAENTTDEKPTHLETHPLSPRPLVTGPTSISNDPVTTGPAVQKPESVDTTELDKDTRAPEEHVLGHVQNSSQNLTDDEQKEEKKEDEHRNWLRSQLPVQAHGRPQAPGGELAGLKTVKGKVEGISFSCPGPKTLEKARKEMDSLLKDYGLDKGQVVEEKVSGQPYSIVYRLDSEPGDTDTLNLKKRKGLGKIQDVEVEYDPGRSYTKNGTRIHSTIEIVSKKEILASLLQRGRNTEFSGGDCSVDKLQESIALRQHVAFTGKRYHRWYFGSNHRPEKFVDEDFGIKKGKTLDQYLDALFNNKEYVLLGCTQAVKTLFVQGHHDYYKTIAKEPDTVRHITEIAGQNPGDDLLPSRGQKSGKFVERIEGVPWDNLVAGDWVYVKNTDPGSRPKYDQNDEPIDGKNAGQEGSNALYIGGGRFAGYYDPNPHLDLRGLLRKVYIWRFDQDLIEDAANANDITDEQYKHLRLDPDEDKMGMLVNVRDTPKTMSNHGKVSEGNVSEEER